MTIKLLLHFAEEEISITHYSTLDINRQGEHLNVNITNTNDDMAFNTIYDKILEFLVKDETFSLSIQKEKGKATFADMTADYYLNGDAEILHFGRLIEENQQEKEENK